MYKTCHFTPRLTVYSTATGVCPTKLGNMTNLFPSRPMGGEKSIVVLQIVDTVLLSLFMVGRNIYIHVASMRIESSANHFTFLIVGNISKRLVMVLYISNLVSFPIFLFFQC